MVTVVQLRIQLAEVTPPVWRRLVVPDEVSLGILSRMLQAAMGWSGSHLHQFDIGDQSYGMQGEDDDHPEDELDEESVTVGQALAGHDRFTYTYDFGDRWEHEVVVEEVMEQGAALKVAECLDGANACPPEDCGGPAGYIELQRILRDPADPEHEEEVGRFGGPIDPTSFHVDEVNVFLRHVH